MNKITSTASGGNQSAKTSTGRHRSEFGSAGESAILQSPYNQYFRETLESIVVAFILAFLFRAFVAEAFVIPTGSMAPTLMGAHKDLTCQECGSQYQVGASLEYQADSGVRTGEYVIGSSSSVCRATNAIDFQDANQATFSGDRILVSKFDYVLGKPDRWDVIVFKFPEEARMNYIKRLVGLPDEDVMIREGDIYVKSHEQAEWSIARKPPQKILAMRQPVADTKHVAVSLLKHNFPSAWQPWMQDGSPTHWKVEQSEAGWSAELSSSSAPEYLRYYHKEISAEQWLAIEQNKPLPPVDPTDSHLVTDYLAYNSYIKSSLSNPTKFSPSKEDLLEHQRRYGSENGMHWVGDLMAEFDIEVLTETGLIFVQLVEFGIELNLTIDVASGEAKLTSCDASQPVRVELKDFLNQSEYLVAPSHISGKGNYRIALANVDDQVVLWVNDSLAKFDRPAEFDTWKLRSDNQRRPYWLSAHPLDAAPIAIGGQAVSLRVNQAKVFRDLYYTAVTQSGDPSDFGVNRPYLRSKSKPNGQLNGLRDDEIIRTVYSNPQWWDKTELFSLRNHNIYRLEEDQYFPLGDNSAQSSDARMWNNHYVDEKYLLGKALLVFWPHTWNRPIPFTPNFRRMGLIR